MNEPRHLVAERGLVPAAGALLAEHAFGAVPFEGLGPIKAALKRFFSDHQWNHTDDRALADAVGPGQGWWREPLDPELVLAFGWRDDRFVLRVERLGGEATGEAPVVDGVVDHDDLAATFDGPVVPEATPNPRTLAFRTPPIHQGESRSYASLAEADDRRVARLFADFADISTVMVARDFVAITLRRPDQWESLLAPVLAVLAEEFASNDGPETPPSGASDHDDGAAVPALDPRPRAAGGQPARARPETRFDRAWRELSELDLSDGAGIAQLVAAATGREAVRRQAAASRLGHAPPDVARQYWVQLVGDPSRLVRRATLDAMVDAGRDDLRPLFEQALADPDAWIRWKALRGLSGLGSAPSRAAVEALTTDADFRVRLEARAALRQP